MDGSISEPPRRSTRRVLLESRRDYEAQSPPFLRSGASVDRKRKLSSGSGGGGDGDEGGGEREGRWVRGARRREEQGEVTFSKRSSNTLYATQHKRPRIHSNSGTVSMDTIVPLRRSKREKRLIFSNLNQQEIYHHMINGPHYSVVDFSDDELDPYEKILSPIRRHRRRRTSPHPSPRSPAHKDMMSSSSMTTRMKLRSSALEHSVKAETSEDCSQGGEEEGGEREKAEGTGGDGDDREAPEHGDVDTKENEQDKEIEGEEEEDEEEEEEEEEEGGRGYYLRKRRPVVYQYQPIIQVVEEDTPPKKRGPSGRRPSGSGSTYFRKSGTSHAPRAYQSKGQSSVTRRIRRVAHVHDSSSTSSSGSDSDEARFRRRKSRSMKKSRLQCLPMNFDPADLSQPVVRDRQRIGASLADIDPMAINRQVTFDSIGGLKQHIHSLKEMILFPLLYPEVFDRFKIQPPRGVLFYGPPGCGKTLVARALANECSKGGKKVAFFMRKGADCLSKWVGESERQLRLLFDQAYQLRPSIIFFDEIDGLAPVRSTRQDQIHSSIVSTLLALMDGLDSRGEVVVIGATNRIDAIDPALRRPGRFDREFLFPLPSREDRASILAIHTQQWSPALKPSFISQLADHTVGYCGADLKSLCTEAALSALRRTYPQIYETGDKLVLDVRTINIAATDFYVSLERLVPTAQRSQSSCARALRGDVVPLLLRPFSAVSGLVEVVFNLAWRAVQKSRTGLELALAVEREKHREMEEMIAAIHSSTTDDRTSSIPVNQALQTTSITRLRKSSSGLSLSLIGSSQSLTGSSSYQMDTQSFQNSLSEVFESSQSHSSDGVYFNMTDITNEVGGVENITMETIDSDKTTSEEVHDQTTVLSESVPSIFESSLPSSHPHTLPSVHRPRLLLCGSSGMGQSSHLGPALLHALEEIPVKTLDLSVMFGVTSCSPEEALTQLFKEANRVSPSIIYLPRVNAWWSIATDTFQATFTSSLLSLPPSASLIVIATAECPWCELSPSLKQLFSLSCETFSVPKSLREERQRFFADALLTKPLLPPLDKPQSNQAVQHERLPVAPPPEPRELAPNELQRIDKQRNSVLRELRMFLREATNKLLAERKFKEFSRPVDPEEVPDYYDIIKEPMDLGMVMKKIDEHQYTLPKQWLDDVDRITKNALEYNPAHDSESRLLLHRAVALQDMAHSILEHELSEEFEQQCEDIEDTYRKLGRTSDSPLKSGPSSSTAAIRTPSHPHPHTPSPSPSSTHSSRLGSLYEVRRRSLRQKGLEPEEKGFDYYLSSRTPRKDQEQEDHQTAEPGEDEAMEDEERAKESVAESASFVQGEMSEEGEFGEGGEGGGGTGLESGWEDEEEEEGQEENDLTRPNETESFSSAQSKMKISRRHHRRRRRRRNSALVRSVERSFSRAESTTNDTRMDATSSRDTCDGLLDPVSEEPTCRRRNDPTTLSQAVVRIQRNVRSHYGNSGGGVRQQLFNICGGSNVASLAPHRRNDAGEDVSQSYMSSSNGLTSVANNGRSDSPVIDADKPVASSQRKGKSAVQSIDVISCSRTISNDVISSSRRISKAIEDAGRQVLCNGPSTDVVIVDDSSTQQNNDDILINGATPHGQNSSSKSAQTTSLNSKSTQKTPTNDARSNSLLDNSSVDIDRRRLLALFDRVVDETESSSVEEMEKMLSTFNHLVFRYRMRRDRRQLTTDLELAANLFLSQSHTNTHE